MKIVSLYAENLKRIRVVEIRPDGALVQITGANGSGKSSVLDAIFWALAGKKAIESQPVRQGEETARVTLDLGEVIVTRKFSADGGTTVTVEAASGARYPSPQTMLDQLLGHLTFDPLAFSRMNPGERSDVLRRLVKLDVDVAALERENAGDYEKRREVNRKVADLTPRVKDLSARIPREKLARVDVAALLEQMKNASEQNAARDRKLYQLEKAKQSATQNGEYVERLRQQLAAAERTLMESLNVVAQLEAEPIPEAVDTDDLARQIEAAQAANKAADEGDRVVAEYSALEQQLAQLEEESRTLSGRMDERTERKRTAIAAATMPIDGLTFGDGFTVLYRGLPFEQASSAEQLRVSVAIAMAMNPRLRVLRIKDGSLLDENNLALIGQMAEAGDYQVWVERVDTSGRVGVVMEDGAVKHVGE